MDDILKCDHSNEILSRHCYYAVKYDHSNKSQWAVLFSGDFILYKMVLIFKSANEKLLSAFKRVLKMNK